jgi:hypothetical protein
VGKDDLISTLISLMCRKNMIGCNVKNILEALKYLALESQHEFQKDRSPPEQRKYNQKPRIRQVTEQNDGRCRADVQMRQINYSGGDHYNRNVKTRSPRAL